MSKFANPGELKTAIEIKERKPAGRTSDGQPKFEYNNIFAPNTFVRCKWVNAHGTEVLTAASLGLKEVATLTLRYTPKITPTCRIEKKGDNHQYEVVSIDDVENQHKWMEVKVKRVVTGK